MFCLRALQTTIKHSWASAPRALYPVPDRRARDGDGEGERELLEIVAQAPSVAMDPRICLQM